MGERKQDDGPRRDRELDDTLTKIGHHFGWISQHAQVELGVLENELESKDEPSWSDRLIEGIVEIALAGGCAGAAEVLAMKLVDESAKVGKAFFAKAFEEGLDTGVKLGVAELRKSKPDVKSFIASQKHAVISLYVKNQDDFVDVGRHELKTVEQAKAVLETFSNENMLLAARRHHDASRDAWVTALAQQTFGVRRNLGEPKPTNMMDQAERDRENKWVPHWVPDRAPHFFDAINGKVPGVLEVWAKVPAIVDGRMDGQPQMKFALLNSVNDEIKMQYAHRPLRDLKIPRQIFAQVEGDLPNFEVNLDETGRAHISNYKWLTARENIEPNAHTGSWAGIDSLLDLVLEGVA